MSCSGRLYSNLLNCCNIFGLEVCKNCTTTLKVDRLLTFELNIIAHIFLPLNILRKEVIIMFLWLYKIKSEFLPYWKQGKSCHLRFPLNTVRGKTIFILVWNRMKLVNKIKIFSFSPFRGFQIEIHHLHLISFQCLS